LIRGSCASESCCAPGRQIFDEELFLGKLILVRHGRTNLNRPGKHERLRAWLDLPLSEEGLEEAQETARVVSKYQVEKIFSSSLRRALQTADAIRQQSKATVIATKSLRPWNLGAFAGQKVYELLPFLEMLNTRPDIPAPGGESFFQFYERYASYLSELLAIAEQSSQNIVAVTHVRNILATPAILEGKDHREVPVSGGPCTGSIVVLEKEDQRWNLRLETGIEMQVPLRETQLDIAS
jgi:alpha-ribazole phosphatase